MNSELTKQPESQPVKATRENWRKPRYEVSDQENGFNVTVELPGVAKEAVEILAEADRLKITGRTTDRIPEGWKPHYQEMDRSDFRLELLLRAEIDSDKVSARWENGVLFLRLPLAEHVKPKLISIE